MSEVKHTPGPWHPGHLGSDSTCQCCSVVSEGYAGGIATVHVGNGLPIGQGGNDAPPKGEAVANMNLIAAASDLLEALKGMMPRTFTGQYNEVHEINHWKREAELGNGEAPKVLAAFAAIAKAEGRAINGGAA